MGLDDGAAHIKAHAQPLGFGRVEPVEYPLQFFLGYARAVIAHRYLRLAFIMSQRDLQGPRARLFRHRLDRICHQIQHHLLDLRLVHACFHSGFQIGFDHDIEVDGLAVQQFYHFFHAFGQIDIFTGHLPLLKHGTQTVDHGAGAFVVSHDVAEDIAYFVDIYLFPGQEPEASLGIVEYGRQRLAQLMRERTRERSGAGHAINVPYLAAQFVQRLILLPGFCDIDKYTADRIG